MSSLFLLISLLFSGCKSCPAEAYKAWGVWWNINTASPLKVYISAAYPPAIRTVIINEVIDAWNSHTQFNSGFNLQYTYDSTQANILIYISGHLDEEWNHELGETKLNFFDRRTGELDPYMPGAVIIKTHPIEYYSQNNYDIYTILRHEIGHALGLADLYNSNYANCLMYGHVYPDIPKYIGDGEDNGLICIYGSIDGIIVSPSSKVFPGIRVVDHRHVSIKLLIGACNGSGTGGADSTKAQMNFYHGGGKSMTWETIDNFPYASRYYEDSIMIELPPDDSNYSGWRVIRTYVYFPDTTIIEESDTFNFNTLKIQKNRHKNSTPSRNLIDIKYFEGGHKLIVKNIFTSPLSMNLYNSIGQFLQKSEVVNPQESIQIRVKDAGIYFIKAITLDRKYVQLKKIIVH